MAITIKNDNQIAIMRAAGKIHARILNELEELITPGISAKELDIIAEQKVRAAGAEPSFLGYSPDRHTPKYPASLCVSINDVIVHGIPTNDMIIKDGDIVSIDLGLKYKNMFTDSARTVIVGNVSKEKAQLVHDTREALALGIAAAQPGNTVGDIGHAIESFNNKRYGNVKELSGHGVGLAVHEDPYVPNYGKAGAGATLKPGMIIAIEPMFNLGTSNVKFHNDGYTVTTADKQVSAHVEHTVLITENGSEILTEL
ncbi:type I methionyl aminopeptidase [Candidatus Campbellbacteria bacterium]|nr:type I methionyl aminopeptidase [Candidatus Campbellbacteria bacterium]|tara:strand:- start:16948 stop:17715 length:768 start_codon:yes stop_codon:yes gene_type:complete